MTDVSDRHPNVESPYRGYLACPTQRVKNANVKQKLNMCDSDTKDIKLARHVSHFLPRHRTQKETTKGL